MADRYRKKPVEIEAVQLDEGNFYAVRDWAGVERFQDLGSPVPELHIETIEGVMRAHLGDWVVRGVKGEFYPVRDDIFRATYEPVEESR